MPWDRGAWEKRTSEGTGNQTRIASGETVNNSGRVSTNFSGGISFCPSCGSMMKISGGALTCSKCGYSEYNISSSKPSTKNRVNQQARKRKEKEKRQKIKQQMHDVLFYMSQGKSRSQASALSGVPLSRISNWYNEGKNGYGYDNIHFYKEVLAIERTQERRKREEINRQNRLKEQERKRKQREAKQRRERLQKQSELNTIKKQMDEIIKQMRNGETRSQASMNVGVPIYKVDEWYNLGWRRKKEPYTSFYNKVNTIEIRNKKTSEIKTVSPSENNMIKQMREIVSLMEKGLSRSGAVRKLGLNETTVNNWYNKGSHGALTYVKFYNDVKRIEDKRNRLVSASKSKTNYTSTTSKDDSKEKMNKIVSYMENGLTRNKAAEKLGISVIIVNNWYNKGSHGYSSYVEFYNDVKSIESDQKKHKKVSKPQTTIKSKTSTKSKSLTENKYCQNCGKKITNDDLNYCSKCGASLKTGEKVKTKKSSIISQKDNNTDNWAICGLGIIVIFIIIALFGVI